MQTEDQKWLALKLVCVQVLGMTVVLATGSFCLLFCGISHSHNMDRWPVSLEFILVTFVSGFFFFRYGIFQLLIAHFLRTQAHSGSDAFKFLKALVWIDLAAMLALVSFTGGLADSFYTPILVIIPVVAFLIQDKPDYEFTIRVFLVSFVCITVAASVNFLGIEGWLSRRWSFSPTTKHSSYTLFLLVLTIVAAGMPFIDVLLRRQRDTVSSQNLSTDTKQSTEGGEHGQEESKTTPAS